MADDTKINRSIKNKLNDPSTSVKTEVAELDIISVNTQQAKKSIDDILAYALQSVKANNLKIYKEYENLYKDIANQSKQVSNQQSSSGSGNNGGGGSKPPSSDSKDNSNDGGNKSSQDTTEYDSSQLVNIIIQPFKQAASEFSRTVNDTYHTISKYQDLSYTSYRAQALEFSTKIYADNASQVANLNDVLTQYAEISKTGLKDQQAQNAAVVQAVSDSIFHVDTTTDNFIRLMNVQSEEESDKLQKAVTVLGSDYAEQSTLSISTINSALDVMAPAMQQMSASLGYDFASQSLDKMAKLVDNGASQSYALNLIQQQVSAMNNPYQALTSGSVYQKFSALGLDTSWMENIIASADNPLVQSALGETLGYGGDISELQGFEPSSSNVNTATNINDIDWNQSVKDERGTLGTGTRLGNMISNITGTVGSLFVPTELVTLGDDLSGTAIAIYEEVHEINNRGKISTASNVVDRIISGGSGGLGLKLAGKLDVLKTLLMTNTSALSKGASGLAVATDMYSYYSGTSNKIESITGTETDGTSKLVLGGATLLQAAPTIIGAIAGGPLGAAIGAGVGKALEGAIDPQTIADRLAEAQRIRNDEDLRNEYLKQIADNTKFANELSSRSIQQGGGRDKSSITIDRGVTQYVRGFNYSGSSQRTAYYDMQDETYLSEMGIDVNQNTDK